MLDRIMEFAAKPVHNLTHAFKPATIVAAIVAFAGAIASDAIVAWSAAIVAAGTVVVPRVLDWYQLLRKVQRDQYAADIALDKEILANEVRKRVELEAECRQLKTELKTEISQNRHRVNDLEQQILVMREATAQIDSQVKRITTPDPDAPPKENIFK